MPALRRLPTVARHRASGAFRTSRPARAVGLALAFAASATVAGPAGPGLSADAGALAWGRVQTRVAFSAGPAWAASLAGDDGGGLKVSGLALMGDVYLSATRANAVSGFRATSGLLVGSRSALWGTRSASAGGLLVVDRRSSGLVAPALHAADLPDDGTASTVPYLGIGYSSLPSRGGWSWTADLGLVSRAPGNAVRLGRVFSGSQNLDDVVRDLKLAPVVQLGVTYAF